MKKMLNSLVQKTHFLGSKLHPVAVCVTCIAVLNVGCGSDLEQLDLLLSGTGDGGASVVPPAPNLLAPNASAPDVPAPGDVPIVSLPGVAITDPALQRGLEQYQLYCQVCHGARGEGVGAFPNLTNCATCTDAKAFFDVSLATMPPGAVGTCDTACTQSLTDYWFSPARTDLMNSPAAQIDIASLDGRSLYIQQCQVCHGADGRGTPGNPGVLGESRAEFIRETLREMPTADPTLCDELCSNKIADFVETNFAGAGAENDD